MDSESNLESDPNSDPNSESNSRPFNTGRFIMIIIEVGIVFITMRIGVAFLTGGRLTFWAQPYKKTLWFTFMPLIMAGGISAIIYDSFGYVNPFSREINVKKAF